jgi:flavin-dependent dehydrogenase
MNAPLTILSAGSSRLSQNAGDGWFAAGDAAISFDPLSGQGLITAMRGGQRAAQAILETMSGNKSAQSTYAEALEELARDYHIKKSRYYSAETRWPDSPFWQRRLEPRRLHAASVG